MLLLRGTAAVCASKKRGQQEQEELGNHGTHDRLHTSSRTRALELGYNISTGTKYKYIVASTSASVSYSFSGGHPPGCGTVARERKMQRQ